MTHFDERLLQARYMACMTRKELAERSGVSSSTIVVYEKGYAAPLLYNAVLLANALEISLDWLAGRTEETEVAENIARDPSHFGARLKEARTAAGLKMCELAARAGTKTPIHCYENEGNLPRLQNAAALADVMGVSIDWLVSEERLA